MLQFPAFMTQHPESTTTIPSSLLLPSQWPPAQTEELLLALEESDFEDKDSRDAHCDEIRKADSNIIVIGKSKQDNNEEGLDNDPEDDDLDNAEESDADDFE